MNPATGPHGTPRKAPAATAETTEDRLRRELAQSSQAQARESLLREECARLRADNRALKRAEARRLAPPSAALYGPATRKALEGPLLTGGELVVASKERPPGAYETSYELGIAIWLRNNGIDGIEPAAMRRACFHVSTLEQLVNLSRQHMNLVQQRFDALPDPAVRRTLLAALNRHFRAALQRTLQIHRDRRREYADVLNRLTEYQSHVDQHRRDLGYESEHHG